MNKNTDLHIFLRQIIANANTFEDSLAETLQWKRKNLNLLNFMKTAKILNLIITFKEGVSFNMFYSHQLEFT